MSINGLQQQYFANSLDGLTYLDVNGLAINGNDIDIDNLVPYTGADKAVDVGVQPIRTSYIPIVNNDVVNLLALNQTTTGTVGYVDQYYVPYNGAISDTNLGNKAFTVGIAGNTSLSGLVKTELNRILAGYTPATIVVGNNFGTITNAGGVYQSTSTATFASLFLGSVVVGEKYSISLSLKCIDPNYTTNIYIYEASLPNFTVGGLSLLSFNIPINTTGFTVFTGTFTPTTYTNLVLVFNTQIVTGINTLYWNAFSLTGMGSVVKNLIAPTSSLDGTNKTYVDTADALRVPYTGATSNVNLGSNSIISTTAQFTAITSATPSLALGVDGSGNLRSFAVPVAVNLLPLNNVWTGINYHNDQVIFNANVGAFGGQFQIDGYDLGYTGSSLTASTGASISFSSPTWTCSTVSSRTALITFNVASYIGKYIKCTWTNVAPVTLFVSPYPYFVVSNNGTTVYSSPQPMTGTAVNYTFSFRPTTAITNILITVQATGTPSVPAVQWTGFAIIEVDTTISNARFNGNVGVGTTNPANRLTVQTATANYGVVHTDGTIIVGTFVGGSSGGGWFGTKSNHNLNFFTNDSSARLTIDTAGNVGIGITNPSNKLQVVGDIYASGAITAGGNMNCSIISPSGGYGRLDDRSLRPVDINAATEQFFFASYNNDGGGPYADAIGMNGWVDGSGGNTNVLMVNKSTFGIRQYQGTFGSTTPFTSAQYQDVCMKGVGDNTKTIFQPVGGTWNIPLTVGSGTDNGGAQLITTNGNIHIDPSSTANELYLGYYRSFINMQMYASNSINHRTRFQYHYANVNADAMAYYQNASAGSSAYFNIIIANNIGNVNHFLNSTTRSADGGERCYTIRNDTFGGVRFMGTNGGFSSYDGIGTGGANYCNAIANYTNTINGNIGSWSATGYTLFCNTSQPTGSQAALGIGCQNYLNNFITSLSPGVRWMDLYMYAANTYLYCNGTICAYSYSGGWANISDEREKEDINDLKTSRSLERIMKCKPKYYKRKYYEKDKEDKDATPIPQSVKDIVCVGLLAQDVLQHTPHCVSGWKNENIKETDDDDGSRYGINYGDFTVHLIGAVQEQQKQIDTLTQRSVILESHARELEKQLAESIKSLEDYKALTEERFNKLVALIQKK